MFFPEARVSAVLLGAGGGKRMGTCCPKQYLQLGGKPVIVWAAAALEASPLIKSVVMVAPEGDMQIHKIVREWCLSKVVSIVDGGDERQKSVYNGLLAVPPDSEYILIHDGARPFLTQELIERTVKGAMRHGASLCAVPSTDTLKLAEGRSVRQTLDRSRVWRAQTPQVFRRDIISIAHELARQRGDAASDDASLVELAGYEVVIVDGSHQNVKLTTPVDMVLADAIIRQRTLGGE